MKKICAKEQDNLIKIKVKLLEKVKNLTASKRKKVSQEIFSIFDSLPDFKNVKLVDVKCKNCTFPKCDHAQSLVSLLDEVSESKAEDVSQKIERNKYVAKLFQQQCKP
ncbi:MAG: hypothetical protein HQL67_01515 [Magnetococcales bacterium]|nr:hypothetical protein [Magnetococcales bacterium]